MAKFLLFLALLLPGIAAAQSCTTTLSAGANVANAVSSAAAGDTICLNSGSYGTQNFWDITKSNYVTVKSVTGRGATLYPSIGNTDFLRLDSVSITGGLINNCSTNIQIINTTVGPNTDGIHVEQSTCPTTAQNLLFDNLDLTNVGQATQEGRISIRGGNTITISNSQFIGVWTGASNRPSDGINLYDRARNVTITGNTFRNIQQSVCNENGGAHCDTVQVYATNDCDRITIEKNWIIDSSSMQLTEAPCTNSVVRDNVYQSMSGQIQIHCWIGVLFEHNTLYDAEVTINGASSSGTFRNNLFHNSNYSPDGPGTGGICTPNVPCPACTESYSLYNSGCSGTNCVTGTPTYVGGTAPQSTWAGWQLSSGSAGENSGSDGQDRGTRYYGTATGPSAPTNFRLVRPFPWPLIVTELN